MYVQCAVPWAAMCVFPLVFNLKLPADIHGKLFHMKESGQQVALCHVYS